MTRGLSILLGVGLLWPLALPADPLAIHLDLHFKGCDPEDPVITVVLPGGETEDAIRREEGRWRITLEDAVDPETTELAPQLEGFDFEPSTGKETRGKGSYTFRCRRLATVIVQSSPFNPPLPFHYNITKPVKSGDLDTSDCKLTIHPHGGITISLQTGECQYQLPDVSVRTLTREGEKEFLLLDYWAQSCHVAETGVAGLEMEAAAIQVTRARARRARSEASAPEHKKLILFLDEPEHD